MNEDQRFALIEPALDKLTQQLQADVDRTYRAYDSNLDYVHKMLLLTAGVIAFVPGLLNRQGMTLNPFYLQPGVLHLFIALTIAVAGAAISRFQLYPIVSSLAAFHLIWCRKLGEASQEKDTLLEILAQAGTEAAKEHAPTKSKLKAFMVFCVLIELAFYGFFISGLWNVYQAGVRAVLTLPMVGVSTPASFAPASSSVLAEPLSERHHHEAGYTLATHGAKSPDSRVRLAYFVSNFGGAARI